MLQHGTFDWNLLGSPPPPHATFPGTHLQQILDYGSSHIRFYSAVKTSLLQDGDRYDTVMAVGFNNGTGITAGNQILIDEVPCPPECHIAGATETNLNIVTLPFQWLSLTEARAHQQPSAGERFSAEVSQADLLEFFNLPGFYKLRVHYAWTSATHIERTFLFQGAYANGSPIQDIYLLVSTPVQNPVL